MGEKENQCEYIEQAADETIKMMLVVILPISFPSFLWLFTWKIFVFGHSGRKKTHTLRLHDYCDSKVFLKKSIINQNKIDSKILCQANYFSPTFEL